MRPPALRTDAARVRILPIVYLKKEYPRVRFPPDLVDQLVQAHRTETGVAEGCYLLGLLRLPGLDAAAPWRAGRAPPRRRS
jgi:hypothetical protein